MFNKGRLKRSSAIVASQCLMAAFKIRFSHRQNQAVDIYPDKFLAHVAYTASILSNVLMSSLLSLFLRLCPSLLFPSTATKDRGKRDVISRRANNHYRLLFALVFSLRALPFHSLDSSNNTPSSLMSRSVSSSSLNTAINLSQSSLRNTHKRF